MSAHVLLNLLNEFGTRDNMRGLSSILYLFRNELNKFNNTGARTLYYIYHRTLILNKLPYLGRRFGTSKMYLSPPSVLRRWFCCC